MDSRQTRFFESLGGPFGGDEIFDDVADTVYFVKDAEGRYLFVNDTLVARCGMQAKSDLVGRTAAEVFPGALGDEFESQDREILAGGAAIRSQLELHIYPDGKQGWCLTWKRPLRGKNGEIVGVAGISRDVGGLASSPRDLDSLAVVMDYVRVNLEQPLRLRDLAEATGLSTYQITQRMEGLLGLSPKQFINRCRIDRACHLLEATSDALSDIALGCGFSDQSSFTRQFGRIVGMTPRVYREQKRS